MPVSHVGLTVSHIPSSSSFFLAALQPLGYRFIGKQNDQVGFGTDDADFFLSPETTGIKPSNAHVAFSAISRLAVRDFYAAALTAGGQPNGPPASRGWNGCIFNAAVLDLDGNSIEVIYHEDENNDAYTTIGGSSRVVDYRRHIVNVLGDDDRSTFVSDRTSPASVAESASRSEAPSIAHTSSAPGSTPANTEPSKSTTNAVIGGILGAAAGAAIAYAMVKSERDSARQEAEFAQALAEKATKAETASKVPSKIAPSQAQARTVLSSGTTSGPSGHSKSVHSRKKHRNYSTTESVVASRVNDLRADSDNDSEITLRPANLRSEIRAIEAPPESQRFDAADPATYRNPTCTSLTPSRASREPQSAAMSIVRSRAPSRAPTERQIEYIPAISQAHTETPIGYVPAASVASSRPSTISVRTATSSPSAHNPQRYIEDVPAPQSYPSDHGWAPQDLIVARRDSAISMGSIHSAKSKHSRHSRSETSRSRRSGHRDRSLDRASIATDSSRRSVRSHRHGDAPSSHHSTTSRRSSRHRGGMDRDLSPSSRSTASTIKASQHDGYSYYSEPTRMPLPGSRKTSICSTADLPLPVSRESSVVSAADIPMPVSGKTSVVSAADLPLPVSRKTSLVSGAGYPLPESRRSSLVSAMERPLPASRAPSEYSSYQIPLPESRKTSIVGSVLGRSSNPVIDDLETVVPDDSISCVGLSRSRSHSRRREHSRDRKSTHSSRKHKSRHGESSSRTSRQRSENGSESTVKPDKGRRYSAATLPVYAKNRSGIERSEKKGKRSVVSMAFGG